jgi:hypothetical protein
VDTRNRDSAGLETDGRRSRRQGSGRRDNDNERADLEDARRALHELKAEDVRDEEERRLRKDLVDDGLDAVAAHDGRTVGTDRQDGKDQLRDDEADDQERKEGLRARRATDRLQELASDRVGIGRRHLGNLGNGVIDGLAARGRTLGAHEGGHDLGTTGHTAKRRGTHLLESWANQIFVKF